jgi:hypothetical protein
MIERDNPRTEEQAGREVTGQRDEHGFGQHNVDVIRERTASIKTGRQSLVENDGEDIPLPAEPPRSAATVIEALDSNGEAQEFWTPDQLGGWLANSTQVAMSWPLVVAESMRAGWSLVRRRATA